MMTTRLKLIRAQTNQAVIYEGMRMRPPSPLLFLKVVPPEGDVIDGKFVSGGTAVGMNTSALLNSKKLFGEDADLFRPERFTKASSVGKREEMQRNVELIFGYGRYMCVGKPIVWIELNLFFFEVSYGCGSTWTILCPLRYKCIANLDCL